MSVQAQNHAQSGSIAAGTALAGIKPPLIIIAFTISSLAHGALFTALTFIPLKSSEHTAPKIRLSRGDAAIRVRILSTDSPDPAIELEDLSPADAAENESDKVSGTIKTTVVQSERRNGVEPEPRPVNEVPQREIAAHVGQSRQMSDELHATETAGQQHVDSNVARDAGVRQIIEMLDSTRQVEQEENPAASQANQVHSLHRKRDPLQTEHGTPPAQLTAAAAERGIEAGVEIVNLPLPVYPLISRRRGEQGVVLLEVEVLPTGRSAGITVLSDPGHRLLLEAAINAAELAEFRPAMLNGRPVRDVVRIPFRFVLR